MFSLTASRVVPAARASLPVVSSVRGFVSSPIALREQTSEELGAQQELVRDFLSPEDFFSMLTERKIDFYTGVPDSLLKDFCGYVTDNTKAKQHVIAANEGAAVAIGAGHHLATGKIPLVYMQNSGLGNTVNPLLSLASSGVYSIPMLMLIGWRGEPGKKDEPQHQVQGAVTPAMLASMGIPFQVLPDFADGAEDVLNGAVKHMYRAKEPYALLVKRQTFLKYKMENPVTSELPMNREDAMRLLVDQLDRWDVVVCTTGFAGRELFEIREDLGHDHGQDFLCVGSMGHSTGIALGVALAKPSRNVFIFDGDGAALMHLGSMASIGTRGVKNIRHILLNNAAHDSVGAQPSGGDAIDFCKVAEACGYTSTASVSDAADIPAALSAMRASAGPAFLEIRVRPGARGDLGRPTTTPVTNKRAFMSFLHS